MDCVHTYLTDTPAAETLFAAPTITNRHCASKIDQKRPNGLPLPIERPHTYLSNNSGNVANPSKKKAAASIKLQKQALLVPAKGHIRILVSIS